MNIVCPWWHFWTGPFNVFLIQAKKLDYISRACFRELFLCVFDLLPNVLTHVELPLVSISSKKLITIRVAQHRVDKAHLLSEEVARETRVFFRQFFINRSYKLGSLFSKKVKVNPRSGIDSYTYDTLNSAIFFQISAGNNWLQKLDLRGQCSSLAPVEELVLVLLQQGLERWAWATISMHCGLK